MQTTSYKGIGYGMGRSNIDHDTGIRYGVIPCHAVGQAWYEDSEADYGKATCPKCGNEAAALPIEENIEIRTVQGKLIELITADDIDGYEYEEHECADYACIDCKYVFGSESAFGDEPISFTYDADGYQAEQGGDDTDIFIVKSPYFTFAQFCSPCAPGAVYLLNPLDTPEQGNKGYCFGHDWFEDGKAPYPVYSVETGELVKAD